LLTDFVSDIKVFVCTAVGVKVDVHVAVNVRVGVPLEAGIYVTVMVIVNEPGRTVGVPVGKLEGEPVNAGVCVEVIVVVRLKVHVAEAAPAACVKVGVSVAAKILVGVNVPWGTEVEAVTMGLIGTLRVEHP
jgi:hypothetical protein